MRNASRKKTTTELLKGSVNGYNALLQAKRLYGMPSSQQIDLCVRIGQCWSIAEYEISESGESDESDRESLDAESGDSDDEEWSSDLHHFDTEPFQGPEGLTTDITQDAKAVNYFSLIFDENILSHIANETNKYARMKLANTTQLWQDVTVREIKAYFGIYLIMGINYLPRIAMYWSTDPFIGNRGIQEVMIKNRFEEITQYLHFADSDSEPRRGEANFDRLFKIRPIMNCVLENVQKVYQPSQNISINEGMIGFKGRLAFRQYMPAKPTKYGIKVWMAADAKNGFVANFDVYLG
ncbi:hypothetical protein QZH41_004407 [Actinostola sp. cb2023]|nr:hypothetical protein QZH41_004407 [Actinostola sp. cb2023]